MMLLIKCVSVALAALSDDYLVLFPTQNAPENVPHIHFLPLQTNDEFRDGL